MSLLHQSLYHEDDVRGVNTKEYITQLVHNLIDTYTLNENIETELDIVEINLDVEVLIPIGLVANELICNALKHGIGDNPNGKLIIKLIDSKDEIILHVQDNGGQLEGNILEAKKESLGVKLIQSFANRLDADIQVEGGKETTITMHINKENINCRRRTNYLSAPVRNIRRK